MTDNVTEPPPPADEPTPDQPMPAPERGWPTQGADAFLAVSQGRLEQQMATLDALDSKAQATFAGASAEIGFLLAILAIRPADHPLSVWSWLGIAGSLIVAAVVLWTAWSGQRVREWGAYPSNTLAWNLGNGPMPLAWEMGLSLAKAHADNESLRKAKTKLVKRAGTGLLALTAVIAAAALAISVT